jgi:manganese/zinc/iron transport system permease protein
MWDELLNVLTMRDSTTRTVMLGVGSLGVACGVVGCLTVLRRRALIADAVAHAALPGVCVSFLVLGERELAPLLLGALVAGLIASGIIAFMRGRTRVKDDALIAVVIGVAFAIGIVLLKSIERAPGGNKSGLDGFIFGKAASMIRQEAVTVAVVSAALVAVVLLLFKVMKLVTFDPAFARSAGLRVGLIDLLIVSMVCVCTVVGLPAVGALMIVALMIIPAVTARSWTDRFSVMLVIAGAVGGAGAIVGTALSASVRTTSGSSLPVGPTIVLTIAALCVLSLTLSPKRGVLAGWLRHRRARRAILAQRARERAGAVEAGVRIGPSPGASGVRR